MLSEIVRKRKINTAWYPSYVKCKKYKKLMTITKRLADTENKLVISGVGRGNIGVGSGKYKLLGV